MSYKFTPISLKSANEFVLSHHRHNKPVAGHKFSIGLTDSIGNIVGVGIASRPVARMADDGKTIEIVRVCVKEGYKNACSQIYARLIKISRLLGYQKVITYTLAKESGATMRALGAKQAGILKGREWSRAKRPRISQTVYAEEKIKWILNQ